MAGMDELRHILLTRQFQDVLTADAAGRRPGSAPPIQAVDDPSSPHAHAGNSATEFQGMFLGSQSYQNSHMGMTSTAQDAASLMLDAGAEERLRSDPEYIKYYYANKNCNPRLPPPIVKNRDNGRNAWMDKQNGMEPSYHASVEQTQAIADAADAQAQAAFNILFGTQMGRQGSAPLNIENSSYHSQHGLATSVSPPQDAYLSSSPWHAAGGGTEPIEALLAAYSPKTSGLASSLQAMVSGELGGGVFAGRGHSVSAGQVDDGSFHDSGLFGASGSLPHTPGRSSQVVFDGLGSGHNSARSSMSGVPTAQLAGLGKDPKVIAPGLNSAPRAIGDRSNRHSHTPSKLRIGTSHTAPSLDPADLDSSPTALHAQLQQQHKQQQAAVEALAQQLPLEQQQQMQLEQQLAAAAGAADIQGLLNAGLNNPQQQMQQAMYMAAAANMYSPYGYPPPGISNLPNMAAMQAASMYPNMMGMMGLPGSYPGMAPGYGAMPFMPGPYGISGQMSGLGADPLGLRPPYGMMQPPGAFGTPMMPQFPGAPEYAQYYAKMAEAQAAAMAALATGSSGGKDDDLGGGGGGDGRDGGGRREAGMPHHHQRDMNNSGGANSDHDARRGGGFHGGLDERDGPNHDRRHDRNGRDDRSDMDRFAGGGGRSNMDRDRYRDGRDNSGGGGGHGYHDMRSGMNGGDRRDGRGGPDLGRRDNRGRRDDGPDRRIDPLLEEFKINKSRKFEFKDIFGHIYEFSLDQHGSRFIQQKLEGVTAEELTTAFTEVLPRALTLCTDVFGNYVYQKLLEHGSPEQRRRLAAALQGHVLQLSLQMYGCRVVQKALEVVDVEQQCELVAELDGHIMRCVRDQNGNHVVQRILESVPTARIMPMVDSFMTCVVPLSTHPFGCRVIQRILEHCQDEQRKKVVMDEILKATCQLATDQYGNYVIQHVLERGEPHERLEVIYRLAPQIVPMALHKFASNVVEKCLTHCLAPERDVLINQMLRGGAGPGGEDGDDGVATGEDPLQQMSKDQFGNYVVQRVLEVCDDAQREALLSRVRAQLHALKKYTYGKHIVARVEKLLSTGTKIQTSAKNKALPDDEQLANLAVPPAQYSGGATPAPPPPQLDSAAASLDGPLGKLDLSAEEPPVLPEAAAAEVVPEEAGETDGGSSAAHVEAVPAAEPGASAEVAPEEVVEKKLEEVAPGADV